MTPSRFIGPDHLTVIAGGAAELETHLRAQPLRLGRGDAFVVHEPSLPGAPYFLLFEDDLVELGRRRDALGRTLTPPLLADLLGPLACDVVGPGTEPRGRAVVVASDAVVGAWAPVTVAGVGAGASVSVGRDTFREPAPPPAPEASRPTLRRLWRGLPRLRRPTISRRPEAIWVGRDDPAPAAGSETVAQIRRTPHLDAPDPIPTARGATFRVTVTTDDAPARAYEESEEVIVEAPPDVRTVDLGVLLLAAPKCPLAMRGEYSRNLTINRDAPTSASVEFEVEVEDPEAPDHPELIAQFHYRGRPAGRVRRRWDRASGKSLPGAEAEPALTIHTDAEDVDVTVVISATGAGTTYTCHVHAPGVPGHEQPTPAVEWPLRESADAIISRALGALVDRTNDAGTRKLALLSAGRTFWNAAPRAFRDAIWATVDHRRAEGITGRPSLFIASDEPLLPWEIMLPSRPTPDGPDEDLGLPLGAAFAVGRWVRGDSSSPLPVQPIVNSFLIAPSYEREEERLDPSLELAVLQEHFAGERLEQGSLAWLDEELQTRDASLLHFVCHGAAKGDDSVIYLDGFAPVSSAALRESPGFQKACRRKPVVFLNACDAGRGTTTLGPGGVGFPAVFSQLGARAIVAPLWPVTKANAPVVAEHIYRQAIAAPDRPLADVLAELRARSYQDDPFDDSWAAYCLFGDPRGRLQPAPA